MNRLRIRLAKSLIDQKEPLKLVCRALGLRRVGAVRVHDSTPVIKGMIFKVKHLVVVEEQ